MGFLNWFLIDMLQILCQEFFQKFEKPLCGNFMPIDLVSISQVNIKLYLDLLSIVTNLAQHHQEVRRISLDISKAEIPACGVQIFHPALPVDSKHPLGIQRNSVNVRIRNIHAFVDGITSKKYPDNADVHQGSVLSPPLFLLNITQNPIYNFEYDSTSFYQNSFVHKTLYRAQLKPQLEYCILISVYLEYRTKILSPITDLNLKMKFINKHLLTVDLQSLE